MNCYTRIRAMTVHTASPSMSLFSQMCKRSSSAASETPSLLSICAPNENMAGPLHVASLSQKCVTNTFQNCAPPSLSPRMPDGGNYIQYLIAVNKSAMLLSNFATSPCNRPCSLSVSIITCLASSSTFCRPAALSLSKVGRDCP